MFVLQQNLWPSIYVGPYLVTLFTNTWWLMYPKWHLMIDPKGHLMMSRWCIHTRYTLDDTWSQIAKWRWPNVSKGRHHHRHFATVSPTLGQRQQTDLGVTSLCRHWPNVGPTSALVTTNMIIFWSPGWRWANVNMPTVRWHHFANVGPTLGQRQPWSAYPECTSWQATSLKTRWWIVVKKAMCFCEYSQIWHKSEDVPVKY